tara:strand:- start:1428 stop:2690 length:1263 start_codon:yes stop_codon:yes gene_type:complete
MKSINLFLISAFFIGFISADTILIKNAQIFDGDRDELFASNILIEDKKIKRISTSSMQADIVIDAENKIVTPGMIATDTELGIVEIGSLSVTRDDSYSIYKIGFSVFDAFNPNSTLIPWNRSNGITSSLTLPRNTSSPIGGMGSFFVLDGNQKIEGKKDVVMVGNLGGRNNGSRAESLSVTEDLIELGKSISRVEAESDDELSRIIEDSAFAKNMELYPRDLKALYKLVNEGMPLIIKSNRASDILKLVDLKRKYDLNIIIMGAQEAGLVADEIAENDIPLIVNPINNIPDSFDELNSNINMSMQLEKKGITLMFNAPRDHNYHLIRQGAGVSVAHGMSYFGALKSITSNPAKVFSIENRGYIKPGMYADILIWDGDPLEPSSIPLKIFINGEDIDLTTRSSMLRDRYIKDLDKPNTYRN